MTKKILIATLLGIVFGSIINLSLDPDHFLNSFLINQVFDTGGQVFLKLLKLLVIPLIFVSLTIGVAGIKDASQLGRVSFKTFIYFLITTIFSLAVGLLVASQFSFSMPKNLSISEQGLPANLNTQNTLSTKAVILDIIPNNPFEALSSGNTLQVIFFSLLFGFALAKNPLKAKPVIELLESTNQALLDLIMLFIKLAPIGVFCLLAKTFAQQGLATILPLGKYFFVLFSILLIQGLIINSFILKFLVKVSPWQFFKIASQFMVVAFSTSSSNATIPISLEVAEKKLGISNRIASFVIPLGATINMNGTSIMQAVATVFISQVYQIDLSIYHYLTVITTATIASIGTAGVPGVGLIMLAMVLEQVGLPVEGIGLILGVDRLLDMVRTVVNVTGDSIAALWVAKTESDEWNKSIFENHT